MGKERESNVGRMPELTEFDMIYCEIGWLVVMDLEMKDSITGHIDDPQDFPDMQLCLRADMARRMAGELLKCADAIDAGLHHPSLRFLD